MNSQEQKTAATRTRLLKAALKVFAEAGIAGATTKEIARVAGVNEVTLFRHFHSKEQLLASVVQHTTALQMEALTHQEEWTQDLKKDLTHYGLLYNKMLEDHEALIRTFIGEAKRHPQVASRIIAEATQPLREKLLTYLNNAQNRGTVRSDLPLEPSVDLLTGMLLAGMLRRNAIPHFIHYSREEYIETCVDLFVRGISPLPTDNTLISRERQDETQLCY
ncbi:TetR/AcrR family transcriptional regulator [Planktothrix mougeotii]|uniref:TetR/AcrR family transcriptional regulator n=1 Tax=Planktothrix mougeotii LEGE 06226 TaxID=1828728 RepID=A0ABR9UA27_9CYAN|nr:TetR/AcrR family transcriptional regulator [Planktothrix mougeotii]MBE9143292.1 TetR/AcrR family transcriptional regulator [Planktothrix mougeotii LEGE 06226]